jgi:hypothetical protein
MQKIPVLSVVATVIILLAFSQAACSEHAKSTLAQQYIPPSYYNCTETTPENLCQAYFSRYFNIVDAETEYNDQVFVFKNMVITDSELKYATSDYIWIDGIIQCYFMAGETAQQLKADETVDIVGIDAGDSKDYTGTLIFTGCIFLPAGSVQLPAGGTSVLTISQY